ncbi:hypothetical protein ACFOY2_18870 [Nonomuraea purpurea]|uniref:Uncharacterized protein n=1 Tax=Nonomuraea purpurea TaxID=1849276 RepID=A0ABV8G5L5_9ACTN
MGGVVTAVTTGADGRRTAELEVWVRRADRRLSTVGWAACPVSL